MEPAVLPAISPVGYNFVRGFECIYLNLDTRIYFQARPSRNRTTCSHCVYSALYSYTAPPVFGLPENGRRIRNLYALYGTFAESLLGESSKGLFVYLSVHISAEVGEGEIE